jgi:hypothetical protein
MDSIDLGRAFKAPFADPQWVNKTLMGWLWMLLGVTAPAVYGAQLDYIKGVSEGREELPDWSNFGDKWIRGFVLMIAMFIYLLPIWILGFVFALPGIIAAAASNGNAGGGLLGGGMCLFFLVAIVYVIGIAIVLYGATVNYALKGGFGSLFAFGEIMGHVRDGSGYFAAWLWALVLSFGASVVIGVLSATFIGYIAVPAVSYLMVMMTAHLFGQWAARSYNVAQAAPAYAAAGYIPPSGTYAPPAPPNSPAYPPAAPVYPPAAPPVAPPAYTPPAPPAAPAAPIYAPPAPEPAAPPAPDSGFPTAPPQGDTGFAAPAAPPAPPAPQPEPYAPPAAPEAPAAPPSSDQPPTP